MTRDPDWDAEPSSGTRRDPESPERREALLTIGRVTAASIVAAVAPRMVFGQQPPGQELPWPELLQRAQQAISAGVDLWAANAQVAGGQVNGSAVFLPPGSLFGDPPFDASVQSALLQLPVPPEVASAFAGVSWEVWSAWSRSYHVALPRAFPTLAAVPAPEADDTPLKATKLSKGKAPGSLGISASVVGDALQTLLGNLGQGETAEGAIKEFARWYYKAFRRWFGSARLVNLSGKGSVPSFAPPYVPVGPVVMGNVTGLQVLQALPFG